MTRTRYRDGEGKRAFGIGVALGIINARRCERVGTLAIFFWRE